MCCTILEFNISSVFYISNLPCVLHVLSVLQVKFCLTSQILSRVSVISFIGLTCITWLIMFVTSLTYITCLTCLTYLLHILRVLHILLVFRVLSVLHALMPYVSYKYFIFSMFSVSLVNCVSYLCRLSSQYICHETSWKQTYCRLLSRFKEVNESNNISHKWLQWKQEWNEKNDDFLKKIFFKFSLNVAFSMMNRLFRLAVSS
jgi:hypothetical protein